eukprot:UN25377
MFGFSKLDVEEDMDELLKESRAIESELITLLKNIRRANNTRKTLETYKQNVVESLLNVGVEGDFKKSSQSLAERILTLENAISTCENCFYRNWELPVNRLLCNEFELAKRLENEYNQK